MSLNLTARQKNAWLDGTNYRLFIYIDHPTGEIRVSNGYGNMEIDGELWLALGHAGEIRGTDRELEIIQTEIAFVLSHIPGDLNISPNVDVSGRIATIYIGMLDQFGQLIDGLITYTDIILSNQIVSADGNSQTIELIGNNGITNLGTETNAKISTAFQNALYPETVGDTLLNEIPQLTRKEVQWVSGTPRDLGENTNESA